jgi:hypothetical protein
MRLYNHSYKLFIKCEFNYYIVAKMSRPLDLSIHYITGHTAVTIDINYLMIQDRNCTTFWDIVLERKRMNDVNKMKFYITWSCCGFVPLENNSGVEPWVDLLSSWLSSVLNSESRLLFQLLRLLRIAEKYGKIGIMPTHPEESLDLQTLSKYTTQNNKAEAKRPIEELCYDYPYFRLSVV